MQPYGRYKKLMGSGSWKVDYHPRPKKQWKNWWEGICEPFSRGRINQIVGDEINNEINNNNGIL